MTIFAFNIYDRHCNCIYNRQFNEANGTINKYNDSNQLKLLFGLLYSLKTIVTKLKANNQLKSLVIGVFRIHYMETLTNFKFLLVTSNDIDNLQLVLHKLYSQYFIENIIFNPLSQVEFIETSTELTKIINNSNFINETDEYLMNLDIN